MDESKSISSSKTLISEEMEEKLNRWLSSDYELLSSTDGISELYDQIKTDVGSEIKANRGTLFKNALLPINKIGNRYSNILPRENTRVILENYKEFELPTDYIHANHVGFKDSVHQYIVTQGPLTVTIVPFWLMVWEQNISVIVMLTKRWENGREKCTQYWPGKVPIQTQYLKIYLISEEPLSEHIYRRKFKMVYMENEEEMETKTVYHLFYSEWSDFGIPKDPSTLLKVGELASKIDKKMTLTLNLEEEEEEDEDEDEEEEEEKKPKILVHCSAGVGRAGTFVTIHSLVEEIRRTKNLEVDIGKQLLLLRRQRDGAVQTLEQFTFIYNAVATWIFNHFTSEKIE